MVNKLEPIINEVSLIEDMVEGLASCLKVDNVTAFKYITEEQVDRCISKMLEAENEVILEIMIDTYGRKKQNV